MKRCVLSLVVMFLGVPAIQRPIRAEDKQWKDFPGFTADVEVNAPCSPGLSMT